MKITIKKEKSPYNANFSGVRVQASEDGPKLRDILSELVKFEQKEPEYLAKAFEQKNVSTWAKIGTRWHPLGNIPLNMFTQFKALQPVS